MRAVLGRSDVRQQLEASRRGPDEVLRAFEAALARVRAAA
jgi:hypothetical protein